MKRSIILATSATLLLVASSAHAQDGRSRAQDRKPVPPQEQQQRVEDQRQRDTAYKAALAKQVHAAQDATTDLRQNKRSAQSTNNRQYVANLQHQQLRLSTQRDVARDPYFTAPMTVSYRVGTADHQTNQYGVGVMQQAVRNGYQQGWKAARADRSDHWPSNYQGSYGYQDANYGFSGNYLPQSDYNYYFREGFQRGYEDAYAPRPQYGHVVNGSPSILGNILSGILGLHNIG